VSLGDTERYKDTQQRMKPAPYKRVDVDAFRNVNDQEKDDPIQVDGVLTEELMKLSFQARSDFQEEIHGVRCMAPEETPELLSSSLDQLQYGLDHEIPTHEKQAYLRSQHPQPGNNQSTYVNSTEFRLRFLRCELFDVSKAALRLVRFLDLVLELFGDFALQRPIRLSDFSKQELKHFRKGRYQFLPYRDRGGIAGRRVLAVFPDEEWESIPGYLKNKLMIYYTWVAGNDVDVQREGLVFVVWFDSTFKVSPKPTIQAKDHETLTVRSAAVHLCSPDTAVFRFRRSIVTMRIGKHHRTRLSIHLGESVELRYKLNAFGMPSDQIPITYTGKIKCVYQKQWMKVRQLIEETENPNAFSFSTDGSDSDSLHKSTSVATSLTESMIESPYLSDIIFRKGASLVSHAGNTSLRTLVVAKVRKDLMDVNSSSTKTGRFVEEVIHELRKIGRERVANGTGKRCRFLVWNEGGWWTELKEDQEIHTRVEYIARGIRNTVIKNHKACSLFAGTAPSKAVEVNGKPPKTIPSLKPKTRQISVSSPTSSASSSRAATPDIEQRQIAINSTFSPLPMIPQSRKTAKIDSTMTANGTKSNNSNTIENNNNNNNSAPSFAQLMVTPSTRQHQNGGTSIFRSLDNSDPTTPATRKRRLLMTPEDNNQTSSTDICEAECFGMKFNSTTRWF